MGKPAPPKDYGFGFDKYQGLIAFLNPKEYRRIQGTELQDPKTNNGDAVGATVTFPLEDALLLVRKGS